MLMLAVSLGMLIFVVVNLEWYVLQFWMFFYSMVVLLVLYWMGDFVCVGGFIGGDLMSGLLVMLTFWLSGLMLMSSQEIEESGDKVGDFSFVIILMSGVLLMVFGVLDLFWFYIFFELVLIPTLLLILGWGMQPERLQAGMYMLFYTVGASLPLLVGLIYLYYLLGSMDFFVCWYEGEIGGGWVFVMILAFLVKLPMFFLHLWLPSAHVEAPVAGSMILAGVLLKLGGYGLFRMMNLFYCGFYNCVGYLIVLSLFGGVLISFICMCQVDLSALIAYSSVSHMGILLGGFLTFSGWGIEGGLVMMLAHGLCSSGLFCLVNIFYERMHTRSLLLISGMLLLYPSLGLFWFLLSMGNMSSPPTINLYGEILLMVSMVGWSALLVGLIGMLSFMSVGYTIYMYSSVQHGSGWLFYSLDSIGVREYLLLFCHLFPMNYLILWGGGLCHWL